MIDRQEDVPPPMAAADAASVLERFRQPIAAGLEQALDGGQGGMYDMLRYHLGLDAGPAQGKAFRPTLCLLINQALGGNWQVAVPAAASVELVHNFSLIHDDIQDGDRERRHRPTLWAKWGIPQAINAGDAMFCLATLTLPHLRTACGDTAVVDVMAVLHEATREMIEGQYLDVRYEGIASINLDQYLEMIRCKTGALLRAAVEIGALLADAGAPVRLRLRRFGEAVGSLFQIRDDMLGVWGEPGTTGKPVGTDIVRKKKSLPVVLALSGASSAQAARLADVYGQSEVSPQAVQQVLAIFDELDVRSRVEALADEAHRQAGELADTINFTPRGRAEVMSLVNFLLDRDH